MKQEVSHRIMDEDHHLQTLTLFVRHLVHEIFRQLEVRFDNHK
jgi:hypothetical protein